jgi:hypothetical protein
LRRRPTALLTTAALAVLAVGPLTAFAVGPALARSAPACGERAGVRCRTLLILGSDGVTRLRAVPIGGAGAWSATSAPVRAPREGPALAAGGLTVAGALARLARSGAITGATAQRYQAEYTRAAGSLAHLSGTRYAELGAVLRNLQAIAAAGGLTASRAPALFLTLARNRQWWTTGPLLASGSHLGFPGSKLVWEYYAGQGIEIQWLATFGEANGYYLSGNEDGSLRQVLSEAIPLAASRARGIAWEYLFEFDGGSPPWTSGLSQGTALQALARAYQRLHEAQFLKSAESALGVFQTAPAAGVSVGRPGGSWYAQYTYAPHDYILNGFIQALVGLYDFTSISGSPVGERLFEAGDAVARRQVPQYNTGSWSRYDQFSESTLSYHELLTEFLTHLCERTRQGEPLEQFEAARAHAPGGGKSGSASGGATGGATTSASVPRSGLPAAATVTGGAVTTGGAVAEGAMEAGPPAGGQASGAKGATGSQGAPNPIPGDQIYCSTAKSFNADAHEAPRVSLLTRQLPTGARAGVQIALSKAATVSLTVRQGARVIWTNTATVEAGHPRLLWVTPRRAGAYAVSLRAVDRVGNSANASGTITLA